MVYFLSPLFLASFLSVSVVFLDFFLLAGTNKVCTEKLLASKAVSIQARIHLFM
jgi:hypothetical protein